LSEKDINIMRTYVDHVFVTFSYMCHVMLSASRALYLVVRKNTPKVFCNTFYKTLSIVIFITSGNCYPA